MTSRSTDFMIDDTEQSAPDSPWRSKKYIKLTDAEILELSLSKMPDKDRYYVVQELEYRGLREAAAKAKNNATKKEMKAKAWWKYIPILFALTFLIKRMFESFNV